MPEAPQGGQPTFNFKAAITLMVQRNASDLLLKVGRPATIRVNGELLSLESAPLKPEELKSLAEQIMTPRQVKEFAEHKEADFAIGVPGVGRFRTNVYQQRRSEEHTSELQSQSNLVCRLLLEKKKTTVRCTLTAPRRLR